MTDVINVGGGASKGMNKDLLIGALVVGGGYFLIKNTLSSSTDNLLGGGFGSILGGTDTNKGFTKDSSSKKFLSLKDNQRIDNKTKKQITSSISRNPTYNSIPNTINVKTAVGNKKFIKSTPQQIASLTYGVTAGDVRKASQSSLDYVKRQKIISDVRNYQNKKQQKATTPTSKVPFSPINVTKSKANPFSNPFVAIGSFFGGLF